jgi:flagellar FliJ protein
LKQFNFRLQKVLEYRQLLETWAKEAYLDARTARLEAEIVLYGVAEQRKHMLESPVNTLDERQTLEIRLADLDDKERQQNTVLAILLTEEEKALEAWTEKRVELQALQKMHDKRFAEWQQEAERKVQAELDEWALRKRAA